MFTSGKALDSASVELSGESGKENMSTFQVSNVAVLLLIIARNRDDLLLEQPTVIRVRRPAFKTHNGEDVPELYVAGWFADLIKEGDDVTLILNGGTPIGENLLCFAYEPDMALNGDVWPMPDDSKIESARAHLQEIADAELGLTDEVVHDDEEAPRN